MSFSLQFDGVVCSMLILISCISFFVHLYSTSYMDGDPHLPRFMSYLSLFTFFMIVLVTSNNLVQLFIGWEGVGLCSYLLISFWFTRIQANKAAIKAMVVNKVGDIGVLLGIILLWKIFGSLDYNSIFSLGYLGLECENILNWVSFLLLIGVIDSTSIPSIQQSITPTSTKTKKLSSKNLKSLIKESVKELLEEVVNTKINENMGVRTDMGENFQFRVGD